MSKKEELLRNMRLYVLISSDIAARPVKETAELVINGGADVIQLREKTMSDADFISLAKEIRMCKGERLPARRQFGGSPPALIINDRINVAKEVDADGVHLGQDDASIAEARDIIGNDKIIGISTHNITQALQAQKEGADYIAIGPIFPTKTKDCGPSIGPEIIRKITREITIPFVAIGAITLNNIDEVLKAGATGVAICSAIINSDDVLSATKQFKENLNC